MTVINTIHHFKSITVVQIKKLCLEHLYLTLKKKDVFKLRQNRAKAGSRWELNPVHLACADLVTTTTQPLPLTILYMHCKGGTEIKDDSFFKF